METVIDPELWNVALRALPDPHVLQSWIWGSLKASRGWEPQRFLWRADGRVVAAAQLLVLKRGHLRLGYVPKGPILDWTDAALVRAVLSDLAAYARTRNLLLLKIDPDVQAGIELGQSVSAQLTHYGWRASFEQVQLRNTMVLDLRPDLDQLIATMKPKWRYNIHLAARKGVTVREATVDDLPVLWALYKETAARDSFVIREVSYYFDVWARFLQAGATWSLIAEAEGAPIAMAIVFHLHECAWYMYGASSSAYRSYMPNHLLQWEMIRRAKAAGCTRYDLWGAPDTLDTEDPRWGLYRFKEGFGAKFVPHIGAYDFTPAPWLYRLYAFFRPQAVALAHWQYWARLRRT